MPPVSEQLAALGRSGARRFWRGLDELLDRPAFRRALADEFPSLADGPLDWDRRDVLRCLGAAVGLAGLTGCEMRADEDAMPYVAAPENLVPGRMQGYATAVTFAGYAQPVIGMCSAGRPTKLEGNPDHPMSRGRTDHFAQAALLDLYDPDRATGVRHLGRPSSWDALDAAWSVQADLLGATGGAGLAFVTGAVSSPTLLRQIEALIAKYPQARWFSDEEGSHANAATRAAFGRPLDRMLLLDRAEAVIAFDADPLGNGPGMLANAIGWSSRRRAFQQGDGGSMLLVAEPTPTLTGGRADRRLIAESARVPTLVAALAAVFGIGSAPPLAPTERDWIERSAKALAAAKGRGLVLVGTDQPIATQGLGFAIDNLLGNLATTSRFFPPVRQMAEPAAAFADAMRAGQVLSLVVIDANPVYRHPTIAAEIARVPFTLNASVLDSETAHACQWHAPLAHDLESWSDARAVDGTATIIQPLVRPFLSVRGRHAMLAGLVDDSVRDDRAIVRTTWSALGDDGWQRALVSGIARPAPDAITVGAPPVAGIAEAASTAHAEGLTLVVRPDPTVWDGRFGNNPWAQELPKPFTTLTWDNAVLVGPMLAARLGVVDGDIVRLSRDGAVIEGPVLVQPGQAPRTILVHRGYGRSVGTVAAKAGFAATLAPGPVAIARVSGHRVLAITQPHHAIDGTELVRVGTRDDRAPSPPATQTPSVFHKQPANDPSWGMAIDLDLCTGCGACVTACDAENNVPMVGRDQVARGREMHWLRVDRYMEGAPDDPRFHNQPLPCMHCEDAPCEMGCPVNAAVHSPEGLNLQVYNRCIGTRTCSSYCPYKVRRFNWYDFTGDAPESVQAQRNPNVTVRMRGVMEKCTYCIQRISAARIDAKLRDRPIRDGDVRTACQQVCPTGAISFGNLSDGTAGVVARKASPRNYTLLDEANTRPRTSYLARIRREDEA